jgi:hypothetical protein
MWKQDTADGFDLDAEAGEAAADAELAALRAVDEWNAGTMAASDLLSVLKAVPAPPDEDEDGDDEPEPTELTKMATNVERFLKHAGTRLLKSDGPLGTLADLGAAIADELALEVQRNDPFLSGSQARGVALRKAQWVVGLTMSPFAHEPAREALAKWAELDPEGFARLCAESGVRGVTVASPVVKSTRQVCAAMTTDETYGQFRARVARSLNGTGDR